MSRSRAFLVGLTVIAVPCAALVSLGALDEWNAEATGHPEHVAHPVAGAPYLQQAVIEQARFDRFGSYIEASNIVNAVRYIEALKAAEAEAARARVVVHRSAPRTVVVGPCGGATNGADQFIGRESGGNPNAQNPSSSAWGCYQIIDSTWRSSCSDIGAHGSATPEQQAQCASRLPLSAWGG